VEPTVPLIEALVTENVEDIIARTVIKLEPGVPVDLITPIPLTNQECLSWGEFNDIFRDQHNLMSAQTHEISDLRQRVDELNFEVLLANADRVTAIKIAKNEAANFMKERDNAVTRGDYWKNQWTMDHYNAGIDPSFGIASWLRW
jgi:hypothetical protein